MKSLINHPPSIWAVLLVILLGTVGWAEAEVITRLSSPTGAVGVPLQLQYQFLNVGTPKDMPPTLQVEGLNIRLTGKTRRVEMVNFKTATSMVYVYTLLPVRPGNFTIPGFAVQANGRQVRTESVSLEVRGQGRQILPPPSSRRQQVIPPSSLRPGQVFPQSQRSPAPTNSRPATNQPAEYFGEIVMGPKSAYVGEVVPLELRFYFRADRQFDNLQPPAFAGDGFTAAALSKPEQTEQYVDGVPYHVVSFRSSITPVKSGMVEIPSAAMAGRMIAQGGPSNADPFFNQFFQNFPMPGFGRAQSIEAQSDPRQLEVQSLPKEGRPENFTGAIGQFTMTAAANPTKSTGGEPIKLLLTLAGRGNFNAITAPDLIGAEGWRTYAPQDEFTAADVIGYGGSKSFAISMVAREDQTVTPGAAFSYFDPLEKEYFTLMTDPVAVVAEGGGRNVAPSESNQAGSGAEDDGPTIASKSGPGSLAKTMSGQAAGFEPRINQGWFRSVNLAVLVAVILSIPFLLWQRRRARKSAQTAELENALKQSKAAWEKAADYVGFYTAAADFILAHLALSDDKPLGLVDPLEALGRRVADVAERQKLESVLARRDELKYGSEGGGTLGAEERRRITSLLEKFASNHA